MTNKTCAPTPGPRVNSKQFSAYTFFLTRALWTTVGATIIVLALFLTSGHTRLSQSGTEAVAAFFYAASIGLPSTLILTWVTHRYVDKKSKLILLIQVLILVGTATFGSLVAGLLLQLVGIVQHGGYWHELSKSLPFAIVISLMIGLTMTTYETLRYKLQAANLELRTKQVEQERAYKLLAEAQLSSLESRIHPHFLFNTLNSIASLIPSDPERAEDTVGKLASLLRFSLNANQTGLVPLSQELKIVRDYLEIEKTRFGARIRFEIAVPADLQDVKVPPLALQSLVENSVKHVVAHRTQGAEIQITASKDLKRILLTVLDDGPGFSLDAITPEHGLGNLIARLELLFGPAGQLQVTREGEKTAVRLAIPL
jgi:sensor histidine kinase YesM